MVCVCVCAGETEAKSYFGLLWVARAGERESPATIQIFAVAKKRGERCYIMRDGHM